MRRATYASCRGAVGHAESSLRMSTTLAGGTGAEYRSRRAALSLLGAALVSGACAPAAGPAPAKSPAASTSPGPAASPPRTAVLGATAQSDEEAAHAGIQQLLDRQASARASADRAAFDSTVDQRNLTWRRIQGDAFTAETARGPRPAATYRVTRVQLKESGYVKAWIDVIPPGEITPSAQGVWVFRLSETG